jgi:hypothetical protein
MNYSKRFVVEPGSKVKLHKIDPGFIDPDLTEKDALAQTEKLCEKLRKLHASLDSHGAARQVMLTAPKGGASWQSPLLLVNPHRKIC